MVRTFRSCIGLGILALIFMASFGVRPALAAGVVGNGTPQSCTEAAFNTALTNGGSITFNCGTNPKTIVLTDRKSITLDTTIDGSGKITLSAPNKWHFTVTAGHTLNLKNLTLRESNAGDGCAVANQGSLVVNKVTFSDNLCAIANYSSSTVNVTKGTFMNNGVGGWGSGSAIYSTGGQVTIANSKFLNNAATTSGGAIYFNGGTVTVIKSKFLNNHVTATGTSVGGAIWSGATLNVTRSTFTGNSGDHYGGAIYVSAGNASIAASTFNENTVVGFGGALYMNGGTLALTNSTLSGNYSTGGAGAGIEMYGGTLNATFVTIARNHSPGNGSGIGFDGGTFTLTNTIVANNDHSNCSNATVLSSQGHNLSSDASCGFTQSGDVQNKNPKLGPLAKNGGPTMTHLLLSGSPAINKGVMPGGSWTDQRGVARPKGAKPDMGAVEVQ